MNTINRKSEIGNLPPIDFSRRTPGTGKRAQTMQEAIDEAQKLHRSLPERVASKIAPVWKSISKWFLWKRVCAWCQPQRRVGGNPWAKNVTHTCCPRCKSKLLEPGWDKTSALVALRPNR